MARAGRVGRFAIAVETERQAGQPCATGSLYPQDRTAVEILKYWCGGGGYGDPAYSAGACRTIPPLNQCRMPQRLRLRGTTIETGWGGEKLLTVRIAIKVCAEVVSLLLYFCRGHLLWSGMRALRSSCKSCD